MISLHISTCERLSVLHKQTRLPEMFDEILNNTPVLEFGSKTPPPPPIEIVPRVWPYPEPLPPKIENSNFLSRVQISPYPEHPPQKKWKH